MEPIEVPKNTLETIRFQMTEFKGKPYADIRAYYQAENGDWKPTKKGLMISPEIRPEFAKGIERLDGELRKHGLSSQNEDQGGRDVAFPRPGTTQCQESRLPRSAYGK